MPLNPTQDLIELEKCYIDLLADPDLSAFDSRPFRRLPFTRQDVLLPY